LINLRNLFQVAVSVDHRYGPFYNLGQAENVRDALLAYGYRAVRQGRITRLAMGPVAHNGASGYFGPVPLPDGRPRIDQTLPTIVPLITGQAADLQATGPGKRA